MGDFLYFVPSDKQSVSVAEIAAAGLGYAMEEGRGVTPIQTSGGPGGKSGFLVGFDRDDGSIPDLKYKPDSQEWIESADGKFWVGAEKDSSGHIVGPGPTDLARKKFISGEDVKLRDGNFWTVPICLSIVRGSTLPKALVLGEDKKTWTLEALPEFVKLCGDAETVFEAFRAAQGGNSVSMDAQEAPRIAADAMAVNYRIGPVEITLLRLWSDQDMWKVLRAIIDVPFTIRHRKEAAEKNDQASAA